MVNTTSNAMVYALAGAEKFTAAGIDSLRSLASGKPRERFFGEAGKHFAGGWNGFGNATSKALYAFKNEVTAANASKIEVPNNNYSAIPGKTGKAVRLPSRMLTAADEFFKAINYESEIHSRAWREASKLRPKTNGELIKLYNEFVKNPTNDMKRLSHDMMLENVFQKPLGAFGQNLMKVRNTAPFHLGRYIAPFMRTPTNIAKFGVMRTPLGAFKIINDFLGKKKLRGGELSTELSKVMMGSAVGLVFLRLALEDKVTGQAPRNAKERREFFDTKKEYSIKIGDNWYGFGRSEPAGITMGFFADAATLYKRYSPEKFGDVWEDMLAGATLSIGSNLFNKTFLSGVSDAIQAISDPERYGGKWIRNMTGSVVPFGAALAGTARAQDPYLRKTESPLDAIKAGIPGMSQDLIGRRDWRGELIHRGREGVESMLSPFARSPINKDPVAKELYRIGYIPGLTTDRLGDEKLTPREHDSLQEYSGKFYYRAMKRLVNNPQYKKLPDDGEVSKKHFVETFSRMARKAGRWGWIINVNDNELYRDMLREGKIR
jgi:hypothetical protein